MTGTTQHPMDDLFSADGKLVVGREHRPGQQAMARHVYDELCAGMPTIVEASTGIGKTDAYMAAGIRWIEAGEEIGAERRIAVVVLANALLDQIERGMPDLLEKMGSDITYTVLKGRPWYVCLDRVDRAYSILARPSYKQTLNDGEKRQLASVIEWTASAGDSSWVGCVDDAPEMSENVRKLVTIEASGCKSARNRQNGPCEEANNHRCPFLNARERATTAQIILTNIDLFLANHRLGGKIFGEVDAVFVDEAHLLHDKVRDSFQERYSMSIHDRVAKQLTDLANRMQGSQKELSLGDESSLPKPGKDPEFIRGMADDLKERATTMFNALRGYAVRRSSVRPDGEGHGGGEDVLEVLIDDDAESREFTRLAGELMNVASMIPALAKSMELDPEDEDHEDIFELSKKTNVLQQTLQRERKSWAYWIEVDQRSQRVALCCSPVRVSAAIHAMFHTRTDEALRPVIFVSATLRAAGKFDFIRKKLAIPPEAKEFVAKSTFDLQQRIRLYKLPSVKHHGNSGKSREQYNTAAGRDVRELIKATEGRALIIQTARRDMDAAIQCASGLGYDVLVQGKLPKAEIVRRFKDDVHSILIGLKTYGTGFDVPGEALELVVIWRMPFPKQSPIDEWLRRNGDEGAWFGAEYMPRMLFELQQMFGRLMRRKTDRGIVAICDPRWYSGPLAASIRNSLPLDFKDQAVIIDSIEGVHRFFAEVPR